MLNQTLIEDKIKLLKSESTRISKDFQLNFDVDNFISYIEKYPPTTGYTYLNPKNRALKSVSQTARSLKIRQVLIEIESTYGAKGRALYHKISTLYFLKSALSTLPDRPLPNNIKDLCRQWYQRIFDDISSQPDDFYDFDNDLFLKDLTVASQRAVPVGGAWISQIFRIKKRILLKILKRSPLQFFELLTQTLRKAGGLSPYYDLHADTRYLAEFNPENRNYCYSNIAEMLKLNPEMKGGCWISWYNDPNLAVISPRLAYIVKEPIQNGARTFGIDTTKSTIAHATLKSSTRKRLYQEGKYKPANYMVIWPRKYLIEWADKYYAKLRDRNHLHPISTPQREKG